MNIRIVLVFICAFTCLIFFTFPIAQQNPIDPPVVSSTSTITTSLPFTSSIAAYNRLDLLPQRKRDTLFIGGTSYNPRGYNYDYGNYLYLIPERQEMVIMEEWGAGCSYRLFLIFNHDVNNYGDFRWSVEIDGTVGVNITLSDLLKGTLFPFVPPLNGQRTEGNQGLYTSVPICFKRHMRMSFWHSSFYNGSYFTKDNMFDCVIQASYCQHMPMWNVDMHKYSSVPPSFRNFHEQYNSQAGLKEYREFLERHQPLWHPPVVTDLPLPTEEFQYNHQVLDENRDSLDRFRMLDERGKVLKATAHVSSGKHQKKSNNDFGITRFLSGRTLKSVDSDIAYTTTEKVIPEFSSTEITGSQITIFEKEGKGVITQFFIYIPVEDEWSTRSLFPIPPWDSLELRIVCDNEAIPQVNDVPLGAFFASSMRSYMHISEGLGIGVTRRDIRVNGKLVKNAHVAYCDLPIPFFSRIEVSLQVKREVKGIVYHSFHSAINSYSDTFTAHFRTEYRRQTPSKVGTPHELIDWKDGWGHIIGMNIYLEGQRDIIQGDPFFWWDNSISSMYIGTGTEDYFNYAHGWEFQQPVNQSQPLCGVAGKGKGGYFEKKKGKPPKWVLHGDQAMINGVQAYRRQIVDCMPFHSSFRAIIEMGSDPEKNNYRAAEDIATLVYFYAKRKQGITLLATFDKPRGQCKDTNIKPGNQFCATYSDSQVVPTLPLGPIEQQISNVEFRTALPGAQLNMSLSILIEYRTLLLRRSFDFGLYNQRAVVSIGGSAIGVWCTYGGNPTSRLAQSDFLIPEGAANGKEVEINITPETSWVDSTYYVYAIHD